MIPGAVLQPKVIVILEDEQSSNRKTSLCCIVTSDVDCDVFCDVHWSDSVSPDDIMTTHNFLMRWKVYMNHI